MELSDIARLRLANQQISGTALKTPAEMVSWFGAVQAQEYALTKWALGLRLRHLVDEDAERDFTDGKILRTHLLRPTWHFAAAADIRWLLALTAPRVHAANAYMYRKLELDTAAFKRCNDILIKTLQGGRQLTRNAINREFKKNKIEAEGHRLSYIMMQAELEGLICSGARQGSQFTYALLEERVPEYAAITPDEALAELAARYFASRSPAAVKDFSTWSGLAIADCKRGLSMVRSKLLHEKIGQEEYFFPAPLSEKVESSQEINFLPIYDEYIMGYKNRDAIFQFKNSIEPPSNLRFGNIIIFGGQLVGTWRRTIKPKRIDFEYDLFRPFGEKQAAAFKKAIRYFEAFHGLPVNVMGKANA